MKTTKEVAKLLKISEVGVIKHAQRQGVKKFGSVYMFTAEDIERIRERVGKVGKKLTSNKKQTTI